MLRRTVTDRPAHNDRSNRVDARMRSRTACTFPVLALALTGAVRAQSDSPPPGFDARDASHTIRIAGQTPAVQPPGLPSPNAVSPNTAPPVAPGDSADVAAQIASRSGDLSNGANDAPAGTLLPPRDRPRPSASAGSDLNAALDSGSAETGGLGRAATVAGSLAVVLGLFFLCAWLFRRSMPRGSAQMPTEVLEVLGRSALFGRQPVQLVRLGGKLLLVAQSNAGMQTLAEVTDPAEVDRIAGLCRQHHPFSSTVAFRQALEHFSSRGRRDHPAELMTHESMDVRS